MKWNKIRSKAGGFTLVEMLVVIGIIAVLVGILLPVMNRVRISAARVACKSNLADLGRSFQMYLNDSKGRLPNLNGMPKRQPPINAAPSVLEVFASYTGNSEKVWLCPADSPINADSTFPAGANTFHEAYGLSYEYNSWMNAHFGGKMFNDALKKASEPPILVNAQLFRIFNDFSHFHGKQGETGNMNFLFADWHVGDIGEALSGRDLEPKG